MFNFFSFEFRNCNFVIFIEQISQILHKHSGRCLHPISIKKRQKKKKIRNVCLGGMFCALCWADLKSLLLFINDLTAVFADAKCYWRQNVSHFETKLIKTLLEFDEGNQLNLWVKRIHRIRLVKNSQETSIEKNFREKSSIKLFVNF